MTTWTGLREREAQQPYWDQLQRKLDAERAAGVEIYPPEDEIFAALDLTPFDKVKVVILGQDPYPTKGEAHGLAFSVRHDVKVPQSLKNIFKELEADLKVPVSQHGELTHWANQGVLLLNTALTVGGGARNSHAAWGWKKFTDSIIKELGHREQGTVFILWGNPARAKKKWIADHHCIIESSHPSPLGARHSFWGSKPFSRANAFLRQTKQDPIDWRLPDE